MLEYITTLLINAAIFALFSLGLNLQWGFAGLVNFGHVAFMTVGAYTTVLLSLNGVPWFLAFLIASAIAGLLGIIIGSSALKLRED
jgi:neutral amino acid transport system permease protein